MSTSNINNMLKTLAAILQQQGQHDCTRCDYDDEVCMVTLCGLTGFIAGNRVARIKARNMDVAFDEEFSVPANDETVVSLAHYGAYRFYIGGKEELESWFKLLTGYYDAVHVLGKESAVK